MVNVKFIHPGEHLEEFMQDIDITRHQFAKAIGVSPVLVNRILNRRSPITADIALKLGRAFYTSAEFWMNLQRMYALEVARAETDVGCIQPLEPKPRKRTPMAVLDPIHPGEDLAEYLDEYGITRRQFAKAIGVSPARVNRILNRRSPITADIALKLGRAFYTSAEFWMNLQQRYDLEVARAETDVSSIQPLVPNPKDDPEFAALLAAADNAAASNAAEAPKAAQSLEPAASVRP